MFLYRYQHCVSFTSTIISLNHSLATGHWSHCYHRYDNAVCNDSPLHCDLCMLLFREQPVYCNSTATRSSHVHTPRYVSSYTSMAVIMGVLLVESSIQCVCAWWVDGCTLHGYFHFCRHSCQSARRQLPVGLPVPLCVQVGRHWLSPGLLTWWTEEHHSQFPQIQCPALFEGGAEPVGSLAHQQSPSSAYPGEAVCCSTQWPGGTGGCGSWPLQANTPSLTHQHSLKLYDHVIMVTLFQNYSHALF